QMILDACGLESFAGADLSNCYLSGIDFTGANLSGANCVGADLSDCYLFGANCAGANFTGANLSSAVLSDGIFSGAIFDNANLREISCVNIWAEDDEVTHEPGANFTEA